MRLKPETRILGIDDASFSRGDKDVLVVGVVYRGPYWIDGLVSTRIEVDGLDATDRIADMVHLSKYGDLRVLMFSGVTIGGFNIVDIRALHEKTGLPVIVVIDRRPDLEKIFKAVQNVSDSERRIEMMQRAGQVFHAQGGIYYQVCGIEPGTARALIRKTSVHSLIPEPLRVSHIIASGISNGESTKR